VVIKTATRIGPKDHGRHMSLEEFGPAEVQEGHLYELARGTIVVSDVRRIRHYRQIDAIREQLGDFRRIHPSIINAVMGGSDCKIPVVGMESERHPDLALYLTPPPEDEYPWAIWIPEVVIEVVSPGSELRDYEEKREEYLDFGVKEYWIVDAEKREVLVLQRSRGRWKKTVLRPGDIYETKLLPGFKFDCELVFEAADKA
jgi:Uma2 family endonuclease